MQASDEGEGFLTFLHLWFVLPQMLVTFLFLTFLGCEGEPVDVDDSADVIFFFHIAFMFVN